MATFSGRAGQRELMWTRIDFMPARKDEKSRGWLFSHLVNSDGRRGDCQLRCEITIRINDPFDFDDEEHDITETMVLDNEATADVDTKIYVD